MEDIKEGIVLAIEEAVELDFEASRLNETHPLLPKGKKSSDQETGDGELSPTEGYGTHVGPWTLSLSERRALLSSQRWKFKDLELGLKEKGKISSQMTKFFTNSFKRTRDLQKSYFSIRIWGGSIKEIEGQLGSGVCAYFKVIVWLLKINFLCLLLSLGLIVGPGGYMAHKHYEHEDYVEDTIYNRDDLDCTNPTFINGTAFHVEAINSLLQFLTGTGWMEDTAMFYGWYPTSNITKTVQGEEKTTYYFSLAYFTVGVSYFFVSLLFMLYNLSKLFNKSAAEQFESKPYSSQVLTFDYSISDVKTIEQQGVRIVQSLKEKMTEDAQEGLKRDFWTKVGIFFLRVFTNAICIAGMVGTVYMYVYQILTSSEDAKANLTDNCGRPTKEDPIEVLDIDDIANISITEHLSAFWSTYAASIIVSGSNVLLPTFFQLVGTFEMYRFQSTRVGITLLRMFIMKLFNISVYLYILYIAVSPSGGQREPWQTSSNTLVYNCWENYIASQLYQLVMVDFIVFCITLGLAEGLRSYLVTRSSCLRNRLGIDKPEFDIATEILDLVHKQMIFWSGFYFAPLFPVIAVLEVIAIFYLKKISSLNNVIPPKTVVLNHQSTFTINCLFLISLLVIFVFIGLIIFNFEPSTNCGPFRGSFRFTDPFSSVIDHSVIVKKYIIDNIKTTSVFVILVILIGLVIYYYRSLAASRKVTVDLLQEQVMYEIAGKKYLLEGCKTQEDLEKYYLGQGKDSTGKKKKRRRSKIL